MGSAWYQHSVIIPVYIPQVVAMFVHEVWLVDVTRLRHYLFV